MYKTKGELTKKDLKEIGYTKILSLLTIGDLIYNCIVMVFFLVHIARKSLLYPVLALIVIIAYDYFKLTKSIRDFHREMRKNKATGREESVELETEFQEIGVVTRDLATGQETNRKYEALTRLVSTESMIVLIASDRVFFPVFRKNLTKYQEAEFISFLKKRPTRINWKQTGF